MTRPLLATVLLALLARVAAPGARRASSPAALAIRRGIRRIAGSSFTGRAISNAVRRVLALDQVLQAGAAQP